MRSLVSSRAAAAAVCAALVLGTAGTAVAATAPEAPAGVGADVAAAPIADVEALRQQTQTLSSLSRTITPVTALLDAVLKADNGQLPAADVQRHQSAIKKALATVRNAAQAKPAGNAAHANPVNAVGADHKAPANLTAQAVASVQKATDALLKASTTKDAKAVATQSEAVVTSLVNLGAAMVVDGALPAPNLPGLPALPKPPGAEVPAPAPELPGVPSTPQIP